MKKTEKRLTNTAVDTVRDFFNLGEVKRIFRVGADLFTAVAPFAEKPSAVSAAKALFHMGKVIVDDMEVWPNDYFDDDAWTNPYPIDFNKIILRALAGKPYKIIKTSGDAVVIHIVELGSGIKVGYVFNTKNNMVDRIYVESDKLEAARSLIKKALWTLLKDDNIILRRVGRRNDIEDASVSLEPDDAFQPMTSQRAVEYSAYLKKCVAAGVSRSVLLYGPPGTGKSTMARTIVDTLGMRSFRIRVEDIGHIATSTVFEAISIFEPDAVILDDFDRSGEQAALLETLEFFQRHVKLVVATVNNRSRLDEAIMRPGRFDELLHIKQMDHDVIKAILGQEHADAFEIVKDWPVAFISEFVKRRRFMTLEEAEDSTKELAARVKRLSKYDDDDPTTSGFGVVDENAAAGATDLDALLKAGCKKTKRRRTDPLM